jgi:hypothetical protein
MTAFPLILCNDHINLFFTIILNGSRLAYFLYTRLGQYLYILWTSSWYLCQPSRKCSVILTKITDTPCELWPMYEHQTPNSELVPSTSRFPLRLYFLELAIATVENMINNHHKLLFNCLNTSVICQTNCFSIENPRILPTLSIYVLHTSRTSNSEYSVNDIYRHFRILQIIFFFVN